ncbi:MAG: ATP-binding protein [Dehalococcoidia bacterium]
MWNIIGHAAPLAALNRALSSGSTSHAYVFCGPEGIGKRTVALEFAAALNCESAGEKPCGQCRPCQLTLAGNHVDVEVLDTGGLCDESEHKDHSDSRILRICQIRRLERILSLSPYAGGRRVAIVDAADTLQTEAANAFLKTLEEPPAGAVIILLAEREERLPETVLSRCQKLNFHRLDRDSIEAALIARGVPADEAAKAASLANGRLGWAIQAIAEPELLEERGKVLDTVQRIAHAGRFERLAWAKDAETRGIESRERYLRDLDLWESWWRDVLIVSSGGTGGLTNRDRQTELLREGTLYSPAEVTVFLKSLLQTREYLQVNVDAQLALENLMLDLPRPRAASRV